MNEAELHLKTMIDDARSLMHLNKVDSAINHLNQIINDHKDETDKDIVCLVYFTLSDAYNVKGDWIRAFVYLTLHNTYCNACKHNISLPKEKYDKLNSYIQTLPMFNSANNIGIVK